MGLRFWKHCTELLKVTLRFPYFSLFGVFSLTFLFLSSVLYEVQTLNQWVGCFPGEQPAEKCEKSCKLMEPELVPRVFLLQEGSLYLVCLST